MAVELLKTNIKRESGKLYFCKSDIDSYLIVCSAIMERSGKHKKVKKEFKQLPQEQKEKKSVSKLKFWRKE